LRFDRQPAQVLAVDLEQVERAEHGRGIVTEGPDQLEHRKPGLVTDDGLAVDQAGTRGQP
jgi:hypothetical protein